MARRMLFLGRQHLGFICLCAMNVALLAAIYFDGRTSIYVLELFRLARGEKIVELEPFPPGWWPVKVISLRLGDRTIEPGKPFKANDEWLKDVSLVVLNRSTKDVVSEMLLFDFPETGTSGPRVMPQVVFGLEPEVALYSVSGQRLPQAVRQPLVLPAGKTAIIPLSTEYARIKGMIETKQPVRTINRCVLRLRMVYFQDGTRWYSIKGYGKPDPENLGRYLRIDPYEFMPNSHRPNDLSNQPPGGSS